MQKVKTMFFFDEHGSSYWSVSSFMTNEQMYKELQRNSLNKNLFFTLLFSSTKL